MLTAEQTERALKIRQSSEGAAIASDMLKRLGWQFDSSAFAAYASPEMREEAGRYTRASFDSDNQYQGFRWFLGYLED